MVWWQKGLLKDAESLDVIIYKWKFGGWVKKGDVRRRRRRRRKKKRENT